MPVYNRPADAANTAVRVFLIKVSEYYLGRAFNTTDGSAKNEWAKIQDHVFHKKCAYCGEMPETLQLEHLIMFNRDLVGLHHPGNIVPICKSCNQRRQSKDNKYVSWEEHLEKICKERHEEDQIEDRRQRILNHIKTEGYPKLAKNEIEMLSKVAKTLYENIQLEIEKSVKLYKKSHRSLLHKEKT
jgi:hypothetical protein